MDPFKFRSTVWTHTETLSYVDIYTTAYLTVFVTHCRSMIDCMVERCYPTVPLISHKDLQSIFFKSHNYFSFFFGCLLSFWNIKCSILNQVLNFNKVSLACDCFYLCQPKEGIKWGQVVESIDIFACILRVRTLSTNEKFAIFLVLPLFEHFYVFRELIFCKQYRN